MSSPLTDPIPHYPGCKCVKCAPFEGECPECGKPFDNWTGYKLHLRKHRGRYNKGERLARKDKGQKRTVIVPDGLGNLEKAKVSDLQQKNLRPVIRFSEALHGTKHKFSQANNTLLKRLQESTPPPFVKGTYDIPRTQALAALKIAQASNVSFSDVLALLVAYGLEHLSNELRMQGAAPTPKEPHIEIKTYPKPPTVRDEYYKSKGLATTERTTTVHELTNIPSVPHVQPSGKSEGPTGPAVPSVPTTKQAEHTPRVQPQLQHTKQQDLDPVVPPRRHDPLWHFPKQEL